MAVVQSRALLGFVLSMAAAGVSAPVAAAHHSVDTGVVGAFATAVDQDRSPAKLIDVHRSLNAVLTPPALRIRIDNGIGPVRLGQTIAQVRTLLGAPRKSSRFTWSSTGKPGVDSVYRFRSARLNVLFGAGRVVSVSTRSGIFRTAARIGVGSAEARVAALPGFVVNGCTGGYGRITPRADTDFYMGNGRVTEVVISRRGWVTC